MSFKAEMIGFVLNYNICFSAINESGMFETEQIPIIRKITLYPCKSKSVIMLEFTFHKMFTSSMHVYTNCVSSTWVSVWSALLRCSEDSVTLNERNRSGCCSKRMLRLSQDLAFLYPEALERERKNTSYGFRNTREEISPLRYLCCIHLSLRKPIILKK